MTSAPSSLSFESSWSSSFQLHSLLSPSSSSSVMESLLSSLASFNAEASYANGNGNGHAGPRRSTAAQQDGLDCRTGGQGGQREDSRRCTVVKMPYNQTSPPGSWRSSSSPFSLFSFGSGAGSGNQTLLKFLHEPGKEGPSSFVPFLPHRAISGVIGVVDCADHRGTLEDALEEFKRIVEATERRNGNYLGGGVVRRIFLFNSFHSAATLKPPSESTSEIVVFPPQGQAGEGSVSMVDFHLKIVLSNLVLEIFKQNESRVSMCQGEGDRRAAAVPSYALGGKGRRSKPLDALLIPGEVEVHKQGGRRHKLSGDLCLLAGATYDGYARYLKAMEVLKKEGDSIFLAGCKEGLASSMIAMADLGGDGGWLDQFSPCDEGDEVRYRRESLPSLVWNSCMVAMDIYRKSGDYAAGLYAGLGVKLARYVADKEADHLRCKWGVEMDEVGPSDNAEVLGRCRRVCELLQNAVSKEGIDEDLRVKVCIEACKICVSGVRSFATERTALRRKAAFFATLAADSFPSGRHKRAMQLWYAASRLYPSSKGSRSYAWKTLRIAVNHGLSRFLGDDEYDARQESALLELLKLLAEIAPAHEAAPAYLLKRRPGEMESAGQYLSTYFKRVVPKIDDYGNGSERLTFTDGETSRSNSLGMELPPSHQRKSSASGTSKAMAMMKNVGKTTKSAMTTFSASPASSGNNHAVPPPLEPVEHFETKAFSASKARAHRSSSLPYYHPEPPGKVKGKKKNRQSTHELLRAEAAAAQARAMMGVPSPPGVYDYSPPLLAFHPVPGSVALDIIAASQQEVCHELAHLRRLRPASSSDNHSDEFFPIDLTESVCRKSSIIARKVRNSAMGDAVVDNMVTFYNPYEESRLKSNSEKEVLVCVQEIHAIKVFFSNPLSVPVSAHGVSLIARGPGNAKSPPTSFVLPPLCKKLEINFYFSSQDVCTLHFTGVRMTAMNKAVDLSFSAPFKVKFVPLQPSLCLLVRDEIQLRLCEGERVELPPIKLMGGEKISCVKLLEDGVILAEGDASADIVCDGSDYAPIKLFLRLTPRPSELDSGNQCPFTSSSPSVTLCISALASSNLASMYKYSKKLTRKIALEYSNGEIFANDDREEFVYWKRISVNLEMTGQAGPMVTRVRIRPDLNSQISGEARDAFAAADTFHKLCEAAEESDLARTKGLKTIIKGRWTLSEDPNKLAAFASGRLSDSEDDDDKSTGGRADDAGFEVVHVDDDEEEEGGSQGEQGVETRTGMDMEADPDADADVVQNRIMKFDWCSDTYAAAMTVMNAVEGRSIIIGEGSERRELQPGSSATFSAIFERFHCNRGSSEEADTLRILVEKLCGVEAMRWDGGSIKFGEGTVREMLDHDLHTVNMITKANVDIQLSWKDGAASDISIEVGAWIYPSCKVEHLIGWDKGNIADCYSEFFCLRKGQPNDSRGAMWNGLKHKRLRLVRGGVPAHDVAVAFNRAGRFQLWIGLHHGGTGTCLFSRKCLTVTVKDACVHPNK